ncbi:MAG: glycosyltransferase family 2 protein [Bacillota bacterium]
MPEISIIMLTYNRCNYLKRSIESVLAQVDCDFEFIIVNNGSTDDTLEICKEYSRNDSRVRIVDIPKSNIGRGRNAGLDAAIGNYISFVDDDDYMEKDMFSYLHTNAIKYDADISVCGCYYDFDGKIEPFYVFDDIKVLDKVAGVDEFLKRERYNSANPCKLFKRKLFDNLRYLETGKYDDIHMLYKLFAEADVTVSSGVPKYYFERHGGNNSGFALTFKLTPEQLTEYLDAFKERTRYLSEKIPAIAKRVRYSEWSYMISMVDKITRYKLIDCYEILKYIKKELNVNMREFSNSEYLKDFEKEWVTTYLWREEVSA